MREIPRPSRPLALALCAALGACGDGATPAADAGAPRAACDSPGRQLGVILVSYGFARVDPMRAAVVEGFDLDRHTSGVGDPVGCRHADFTSPDGLPGIDNQVARLLPVVDSMTGGAFDGLIQAAVNNGQLLVAVTLEGVDDLRDDACVTLRFQRVQGQPFVGSDMRIDPGQTFDLSRGEPETRAAARITGGVLEAGPFELPLPVAALDARFVLDLHGARIRATVRPDGGLSGVLGAGISVREFGDTISRYGIGASLQSSIGGALRLFADLAPDDAGACTQISAGLRFDARPAFVNP